MGGSRWKEGATSLWCPCYGDGARGPASISVQVMDTLISISTRWKDRKASTEPNKFERRLEKRRMETTVPWLKWPNKKGEDGRVGAAEGKKGGTQEEWEVLGGGEGGGRRAGIHAETPRWCSEASFRVNHPFQGLPGLFEARRSGPADTQSQL